MYITCLSANLTRKSWTPDTNLSVFCPVRSANVKLGKRTRYDYFEEGCVELYEPSPLVDYGVVPVKRIVGQALLMPNFEQERIPHALAKLKKRAFPWGATAGADGRGGSRLWMVNTIAMRAGRSFSSMLGSARGI